MAWYFIDSQSRVTVPTGSYMDLGSNGWTLSFFYKVLGTGAPDGSQQQYFISRSGAGIAEANVPSVRINESTNTVTWAVWDSGVNSMTVTNAVGAANEWSNSGWVHVALTCSSAEGTSSTGSPTKYTSLYMNGNIIGSDSLQGFGNLTGVNLIFGRRGNASLAVANLSLTGCMAEFSKFDRSLSRTEIRQLAQGHDPELLSNGFLSCYYPMRNDFVDRVTGRTGVQVNVALTGDHPIQDKVYIPSNDRQMTLPQMDGRIGTLEQRGYLDYVDWAIGTVPQSGIAQTGARFSQARLGDAYVLGPSGSLSGCTLNAYASGGNGINSGTLHLICTNLTPLPITLPTIRISVYRL